MFCRIRTDGCLGVIYLQNLTARASTPLNHSSSQMKNDSNLSAHHVTTVTDAGGFASIRPAEGIINIFAFIRVHSWFLHQLRAFSCFSWLKKLQAKQADGACPQDMAPEEPHLNAGVAESAPVQATTSPASNDAPPTQSCQSCNPVQKPLRPLRSLRENHLTPSSPSPPRRYWARCLFLPSFSRISRVS